MIMNKYTLFHKRPFYKYFTVTLSKTAKEIKLSKFYRQHSYDDDNNNNNNNNNNNKLGRRRRTW